MAAPLRLSCCQTILNPKLLFYETQIYACAIVAFSKRNKSKQSAQDDFFGIKEDKRLSEEDAGYEISADEDGLLFNTCR